MPRFLAASAVAVHSQHFLQVAMGRHLVAPHLREGEAHGFFACNRVVFDLRDRFVTDAREPFLAFASILMISEVDEGVEHGGAGRQLFGQPSA